MQVILDSLLFEERTSKFVFLISILAKRLVAVLNKKQDAEAQVVIESKKKQDAEAQVGSVVLAVVTAIGGSGGGDGDWRQRGVVMVAVGGLDRSATRVSPRTLDKRREMEPEDLENSEPGDEEAEFEDHEKEKSTEADDNENETKNNEVRSIKSKTNQKGKNKMVEKMKIQKVGRKKTTKAQKRLKMIEDVEKQETKTIIRTIKARSSPRDLVKILTGYNNNLMNDGTGILITPKMIQDVIGIPMGSIAITKVPATTIEFSHIIE
nr:hypothetical protein [Tanacetum cinerariifolium]